MNKYTIDCTKEQVYKAIELGAPIKYEDDELTGKSYPIYPTAEQMIGWLIKEHGILPLTDMANSTSFEYGFVSMIKMENNVKRFIGIHSSLEEATLAAIDAALEYLSNNR